MNKKEKEEFEKIYEAYIYIFKDYDNETMLEGFTSHREDYGYSIYEYLKNGKNLPFDAEQCYYVYSKTIKMVGKEVGIFDMLCVRVFIDLYRAKKLKNKEERINLIREYIVSGDYNYLAGRILLSNIID